MDSTLQGPIFYIHKSHFNMMLNDFIKSETYHNQV